MRFQEPEYRCRNKEYDQTKRKSRHDVFSRLVRDPRKKCESTSTQRIGCSSRRRGLRSFFESGEEISGCFGRSEISLLDKAYMTWTLPANKLGRLDLLQPMQQLDDALRQIGERSSPRFLRHLRGFHARHSTWSRGNPVGDSSVDAPHRSTYTGFGTTAKIFISGGCLHAALPTALLTGQERIIVC